MQSMTHLSAAHTATPSPAPGSGGGASVDVGAIVTGLSKLIPGGSITMLVVAVLFLAAAGQKGKKARGQNTDWKKGDKAVGAVVGGIFRALWSILRFVVRFLAGRELYGEPKSDATFFKAGTGPSHEALATAKALPVAQLGSVAAAPAVSLTKPARRTPSPWAVKLVKALTDYRGRGARALDVAGRVAVWVARWVGRTWRLAVRVHAAVWPVLRGVSRLLASWSRWPYYARSLGRLAALLIAFGLLVPAYRWPTVGVLLLALVALVVFGRRFKPKQPGDDAKHGPALWVLLRDDLDLPEGEPMEHWLALPHRLADETATITVRLPWTFRGDDSGRARLNDLIGSRVPGEWVSRWTLQAEDHYAVWTHKPAPKPKPEPPAGVDFLSDEVQRFLNGLEPGELLVGVDPFGRFMTKRLSGETSHWALSIGSGGGKSAFLYMLIAQLVRQKATIIAPDVKMASLDWYEGAPGIHIYNDPENVQDMRAAIKWVREETKARTYIKKKNKGRKFPPLVLIIEEGNEFGELSKEWWADNKPDGAKAGDPIWGDVASIMRLGRFVNVHVIAVFQDLDERVFGNKGLRSLFNLIFMGSYSPQQWKKIIARTPVPESPRKSGRIIAVEGAVETPFQSPFTPEENFRDYVDHWRVVTGYTLGSDVYGLPPARSAAEVPKLLDLCQRRWVVCHRSWTNASL
ncbi:hypothetical protein QMK19_39505 [Streptomyces sp. H10-C2]|uniref:hypothetical protein n=1 Tax=unclassified Streptomyces TaxID=2593676 RepID=UPI0024B97384|nr:MULTISPECIES: hypothetical protein [unclassified Streptomyces]MDJ0347279.1 hypothetical protein [Streptomyces sp. PH10-H1]MDJ0375513.1 hypothetical protein [Streptomyces sp. H10-C2]